MFITVITLNSVEYVKDFVFIRFIEAPILCFLPNNGRDLDEITIETRELLRVSSMTVPQKFVLAFTNLLLSIIFLILMIHANSLLLEMNIFFLSVTCLISLPGSCWRNSPQYYQLNTSHSIIWIYQPAAWVQRGRKNGELVSWKLRHLCHYLLEWCLQINIALFY